MRTIYIGRKQPNTSRLGKKSAFFANQSFFKNKTPSHEGYNLDTALSTDRTAVYANPDRKKLYMAHRGTVWSDPTDVASNIASVMGRDDLDPRLTQGRKLTKQAKAKYQGYGVTHTGTSLGGGVSRDLGREFNDKAVSYNPRGFINKQSVSNSLACKNPTNRPAYCDKYTANFAGGDLVSMPSRMTYGNKNYVKGSYNPLKAHSLNNFL